MTNKYMEMKESERYCSFCNYNNNNNKAHAHSFVSKCLWLAEKNNNNSYAVCSFAWNWNVKRRKKTTSVIIMCSFTNLMLCFSLSPSLVVWVYASSTSCLAWLRLSIRIVWVLWKISVRKCTLKNEICICTHALHCTIDMFYFFYLMGWP